MSSVRPVVPVPWCPSRCRRHRPLSVRPVVSRRRRHTPLSLKEMITLCMGITSVCVGFMFYIYGNGSRNEWYGETILTYCKLDTLPELHVHGDQIEYGYYMNKI